MSTSYLAAADSRGDRRGSTIKSKPYGKDNWGPWSTNLIDLVARAFGPDSAQVRSVRGVSFGKPDHLTHGHWRNQEVDEEVEAAAQVVRAIDSELERRGATPAAPSMPVRSFAKMADPALRGIAERDDDELRKVAGSTVMASMLLAGGVIESILYDALKQRGYAPAQLDKMRLADLVDEAVTAKVIRARAQNAGHAAREARNLIHPAVELQAGRLTKVDADLVKGRWPSQASYGRGST